MAAVTCYNHINEVVTAGVAAGPVLEKDMVFQYTSATADTLSLPLKTPTGVAYRFLNNSSGLVTWAAQTGETYSGAATSAIGSLITLVKTGATTWLGVAE